MSASTHKENLPDVLMERWLESCHFFVISSWLVRKDSGLFLYKGNELYK